MSQIDAKVLEAVTVRPYAEGDADFFFRSFLDSYGHGSPATANIPKSIFYPAHRALLARLMARPEAVAAVACLKEDPSTLIGFVLGEPGTRPVLHYVYVKGPFRGFGVGRLLVEGIGLEVEGLTFTHWTYHSAQLAAKWPRARFNPYLLEDSHE